MDRWEDAHDVLVRVYAKGERDYIVVAVELCNIRGMCELERQFKRVPSLNLLAPQTIDRAIIRLFTQIWSHLT